MSVEGYETARVVEAARGRPMSDQQEGLLPMRVADAKRDWAEVFSGNSSGDWVRLSEAEAKLDQVERPDEGALSQWTLRTFDPFPEGAPAGWPTSYVNAEDAFALARQNESLRAAAAARLPERPDEGRGTGMDGRIRAVANRLDAGGSALREATARAQTVLATPLEHEAREITEVRNLTSDEVILSVEAGDRWWARYGEKVKADLDRHGWVRVAFKDGFKAGLLAARPVSSEEKGTGVPESVERSAREARARADRNARVMFETPETRKPA